MQLKLVGVSWIQVYTLHLIYRTLTDEMVEQYKITGAIKSPSRLVLDTILFTHSGIVLESKVELKIQFLLRNEFKNKIVCVS